ncbi:MAG: IclR family transcriptional regulator [Bifidobacterium sp.]|jgi:DNA-binding IclR family transcriptional regulator|nr:IclR family transcriptional regulator [Bifidobacterium sp.]MCI1865629.1 IclR family transcriptional regulator [Bifidobacterium sp.]
MPCPTPAADRALDILDYIAAHGNTGAAAISQELGIPRSSVYQLLDVLIRHGLVTHIDEERTFGIGLKAFELASAYSRHHRVSRMAHPVLARLVDETGENGHLAVLHGNEIIYVIEERAAHRPPLVSNVGVRLPSHLTASGRAILAWLSDGQLAALYPSRNAFVDRTGIGPKSPTELRALLRAVRQSGFAQEHGDVTLGFDSYAVPVFDYNHFPIAGLALTFVGGSLRPHQESRLKAQLKRAGDELSHLLGNADGTVPR